MTFRDVGKQEAERLTGVAMNTEEVPNLMEFGRCPLRLSRISDWSSLTLRSYLTLSRTELLNQHTDRD